MIKTSGAVFNLASRVLETLTQQKQQKQLHGQVEEEICEVIATQLIAQVVNKPSSRSTESLLYITLLADIAAIQPSQTKDTVNWAYSDSNIDAYASLMQQVYICINTNVGSVSPQARMYIIRALFSNLGGEAGVYLAGVWLRFGSRFLSQNVVDEDDVTLSIAALSHLAAFLQAHLALPSGQTGAVDFQTLLPAVVLGLSSPLLDIRKAAVECLGVLKELSVKTGGKGKKFDAVYAFDRIYGGSHISLLLII